MNEKSKGQGKPNQGQPFSSAFVVVEQARRMNENLDRLLAKKKLTPTGLPLVQQPEPLKS